MNVNRLISGGLALALSFLPVIASAIEDKLSVDFYMGMFNPSLDDINDKEFKAPVAGSATIIDSGGTSSQLALYFDNPLPDLGVSANAGVELRWQLTPTLKIIAGYGTWEASSRSRAYGGFGAQGEGAEVFNMRLAKISFNEFYLGVRDILVEQRDRYSVYYRASLNEIYDIDMREDLTFSFLSGPAEGVDKSFILQSQATGLLAVQLGMGFDYYLREWMSFGLEASYLLGLRRVTLRDGSSEASFLSTDNVEVWSPQRLGDDGNLQYLNKTAAHRDDYETIRLNFDGWKVLFRVGLHF